jgi:hypothetical protein
MDPLSGVLSLVKPHNTMCGGFDVGGEGVPSRIGTFAVAFRRAYDSINTEYGRPDMHRVGKRKGLAPPPLHGGRMM